MAENDLNISKSQATNIATNYFYLKAPVDTAAAVVVMAVVTEVDMVVETVAEVVVMVVEILVDTAVEVVEDMVVQLSLHQVATDPHQVLDITVAISRYFYKDDFLTPCLYSNLHYSNTFNQL